MSKMRFLYVYIFVLAFSSCEDAFQQVVEIELPEHKSKLVTYCLLEDNTSIDTFHIDVYNSLGILEDDFKNIKDAVIKLTADNGDIGNPFTYDSTYYISNWSGHWDPVKQEFIQDTLFGGTYISPKFDLNKDEYKLDVSANGFPTATATSIIPPKPIIVNTKFMGIIDTINETNGTIEVEFDNIQPDFYYMVAMYKDGIKWDGTNGELGLEIIAKDPNYQLKYMYANLEFPDSFLFFEGKNFKKHFTGRFSFRDWYESHEDDKFKFEIRALNEDTYNFLNSVINYDNADGNPFAEPVIITTNFENGYGFFGITSSDKVIFK